MKNLVLVALAVVLVGCTARSPQTLMLEPWDVERVAVASQNETVELAVHDLRGNAELGSRGGVYQDTASVTLPTATLNAWQESLQSAFAKNGWQSAEGADLIVNVKLLALTFDSKAGESYRRVLTNTDWKALVEVEYIAPNGSMVREHTVTRTFTDFPRPSVEDNQSRVEEIFESLSNSIVNNREWERLL